MKSKRKYYSEKLVQFQGDAKKIIKGWRIMKEMIRKCKLFQSILLRKMLSLSKSELQTHSTIFFINIGPKLVDDIPTATRSFESYVRKANETINDELITINELKDAFFPLKKTEALSMTKLSSVA